MDPGTPHGTDRALARALRELLDRTVEEDPAVRNGVLRVDAPGLEWQGASGMADPDRGVAMLPDDPFQAASITKMVTATTLMTLVEQRRVDLDVGIGRYLPAQVTAGLHDHGGRCYGPKITARQLLGHTSGIADFFGDGSPVRAAPCRSSRRCRRTPTSCGIRWRSWRGPRRTSGRIFRPARAGTTLIIEAVTGQVLHEVMRERVFERLGMNHTYMLFREPARPGRPGRGVSRAWTGDAAYGMDRNVSADGAGGGLVTTADDLARFIRVFAEDRIFEDRTSKEQMLTWTPTGEQSVYYGLGARRFMLDEIGMAEFGELWGHTGFLNAFMLYWPERDATICGTLNQSAATGGFSGLRPVAAIVSAVMCELQSLPGEPKK